MMTGAGVGPGVSLTTGAGVGPGRLLGDGRGRRPVRLFFNGRGRRPVRRCGKGPEFHVPAVLAVREAAEVAPYR